MNFFALLFLAFAMSTDAFAVAVCKGVSLKLPKFFDALKVGVIFGIIEAITPILGWGLGYIAMDYIEKWDHWIIFILLSFLGIQMIYNSNKKEKDFQKDDKENKNSLIILIFTAMTTSLDAFAIGVGLALASVNIGFAAIIIGSVTCSMVTIGILLGKKIGCMIGKKAEFIGGLVLITIGCITLYQHL